MAQTRPLILLGALLLASAATSGAQAQSASPATPPVQTGPVQSGATQAAPLARTDATPLERARAALNAARYREAQAQYEALVASDFTNPDAHFGLGLTLYALGDNAGARFEFLQLVKYAPERYEGFYNLGVVATRLGEHDEALTQYLKAADLARDKAEPSTLRLLLDAVATEQARRGDHAALSKTLTEALQLTPTDAALQLRLADAEFRAGNGSDALAHAYAVLQQQPGNADAALLLADIYDAQKLPDRAQRELNKALAATSDRTSKARLLVRAGELHAAQGQLKPAADMLREAVRQSPASTTAHTRLAAVLLRSGDLKGAAAAWHTAVKAEPKNADSRTELASTQLALGQYDEAAKNASIAQKQASAPATQARAQFIHGVATYRQGKYTTARTALEDAALKFPSAETYLWLGLSEYALKNYPQAVTALEASVKLQPHLDARANLGAALLAAGRYPESEAILRGVVAEAPARGEAWHHLGWSLKGQGRDDEAQQAFKKALQSGYSGQGAQR